MFFLTVFLLTVSGAVAHDFESGGICYRFRDVIRQTVGVACRGENFREYPDEYSGKVVIPETVKFKGTTYTVEAIEKEAFGDCDGLEQVVVGGQVRLIDDAAFVFCRHLKSVVFGSGVETIGNDVFCGCESLASLELGTAVRQIGTSAFAGCSGLEHIRVSEGNPYYNSHGACEALIETASNRLIAGCRNTIIPDDVVSIAEAAFYGCSGLTEVRIPASVADIGFEAFAKCEGIRSIEVDPRNRVYDSRKGCNAIIETTTGRLLVGCMNTRIPDDVRSIHGSAFYGCSQLSEIFIPASVTDIGPGAFGRCAGLQKITVAPNNLVYDSRNGCNAIIETASGLLLVGCGGTIIPNTVSQIGERAFFGSKQLRQIVIPNSITEIGESAFEDCIELSSVVIGNGVTSIGDVAFGRCEQLSSLTIGESVASIGEYAFSACFLLKKVVIPNQVGFVGLCAFGGCESLKSVTIGSRVAYIGAGAFDRCTALTDVVCLADNEVVIEEDVFEAVNIGAATLRVSPAALKSYRKSDPWKNFGKIEALTN